MKFELKPVNWFRFGNVINTCGGPSIYCVELASFPETHMLTKFKSDSFVAFSKTIQNIGWNYEKVESWRRSGTVSRVETEKYIFYLDEEQRVDPPLPEDYIDTTPEGQIPDQVVWPVIRSEYSDIYRYMDAKIIKPCNQNWCGIAPECIPECTMCKSDTKKVSYSINSGSKKIEIEPDCCRFCIWWDWFHTIRKNMCGCKCENDCDCGKLKYKKKETLEFRMEKLKISHKK